MFNYSTQKSKNISLVPPSVVGRNAPVVFTQKQKSAIEKIVSNEYKFTVLHGAIRSGKTLLSVEAFAEIAQNSGNRKLAILVPRRHTFERSVLTDSLTLLDIPYTYKKNATDFVLMGKDVQIIICKNPSSALQDVRGGEFSNILIEEASLIDPEVIKMCADRVPDNGQIIMTTNPAAPNHYIKKSFIDTPGSDVYEEHFAIRDNPSITEERLARMYRHCVSDLYRQRFLDGLWVTGEGIVYTRFQDALIEYADTHMPNFILGIDFGLRNPTAVVLLGEDAEKNLTVIASESTSDLGGLRNSVSYIETFLVRNFDRIGRALCAVYVDPSAVALIEELSGSDLLRGYIVPANNKVLDGLYSVSKGMGDGRLRILNCKENTQLIEELANYRWDSSTDDERPIKQNDHLCDALRYAYYSHVQGMQPLHTQRKNPFHVQKTEAPPECVSAQY